MNINQITLILTLGLLMSCQTKKEKIVFKKPQIINTQTTDFSNKITFNTQSIAPQGATIIGKFQFTDTIDINPKKVQFTTSEDYITGHPIIKIEDRLDINNFELIVDYQSTVRYNRYFKNNPQLFEYYPVYFVNSSTTDKVFLGKDATANGIQEAFDQGNLPAWKPIESLETLSCGNGKWALIVHPQEFVLVLMKKYHGDYETKMRVQFTIGKNVFTSKPFKGKINKGQFSIKPKT